MKAYLPEIQEIIDQYVDLSKKEALQMGADPEEVKEDILQHIQIKLKEDDIDEVSVDDIRKIISDMGPADIWGTEPEPENEIRPHNYGSDRLVKYLVATIILVALLVYGSIQFLSLTSNWERISPYKNLVWESETEAMVQVEDETWYKLVAINGVSVDELVSKSSELYDDEARRRIREDIADVLYDIGVIKKSIMTVDLDLI